jgi:hypothetical protein
MSSDEVAPGRNQGRARHAFPREPAAALDRKGVATVRGSSWAEEESAIAGPSGSPPPTWHTGEISPRQSRLSRVRGDPCHRPDTQDQNRPMSREGVPFPTLWSEFSDPGGSFPYRQFNAPSGSAATGANRCSRTSTGRSDGHGHRGPRLCRGLPACGVAEGAGSEAHPDASVRAKGQVPDAREGCPFEQKVLEPSVVQVCSRRVLRGCTRSGSIRQVSLLANWTPPLVSSWGGIGV